MNSDYLLQAAGPHSRGLRLSFPLTTAVGRHLETRRTGLPVSHAGVADVPSTPDPLSAMVWITKIIESLLRCRQTFCLRTPPSQAPEPSLGIPPLERRSHRKSERLARFAQQETRGVGGLGKVIGVIASRLALPNREHAARNG